MIKQTAKVLFLFILAVNISACSRDKCKNVGCPSVTLPGYTSTVPEECYDGVCLCPDGYEGTDCQTPSYLKYQGNYVASENCGGVQSGNNTSYDPYIQWLNSSSGYGPNAIGIYSFWNTGTLVALIENTSSVNLGTTLYIPPQTLGATSIYASYGTYYGSAQSNTGTVYIVINLNYGNQNGNFQCQETLYCSSGGCQ
jgi:hypothetical protein